MHNNHPYYFVTFLTLFFLLSYLALRIGIKIASRLQSTLGFSPPTNKKCIYSMEFLRET